MTGKYFDYFARAKSYIANFMRQLGIWWHNIRNYEYYGNETKPMFLYDFALIICFLIVGMLIF